MSKWTEVRDGVLSQINAEAMTEQFKQELYNKVVTEFLPFISDIGEQTAKALEESAKTENSTWCKIRDSFILPTMIRVSVWAVTTMLTIKKVEDVR